MTDLRQAAQAVIDDFEFMRNAIDEKLWKSIEDLRQALVEPAPCSTHPMAPHGFNRNASHSSDEYVCDCAGFDPYDAGYQAGIHAAWDSDGLLLPDGWVLVPIEPSVDALIAEIDELCFDEASGGYFWPESIHPSVLKELVDKYRGIK